MTYADDMKAKVVNIALAMRDAASSGALTVDLSAEALNYLRLAHTRLVEARASALEELGIIKEKVIPQMTELFQDSLAMEVTDAIAKLTDAKRLVESYANHLQHKIDQLERDILLLQKWYTEEINASGAHFQEVSELLAQYRNKL